MPEVDVTLCKSLEGRLSDRDPLSHPRTLEDRPSSSAVQFNDENGGGPAVRLRKPVKRKINRAAA
jgi:hypothetical protein